MGKFKHLEIVRLSLAIRGSNYFALVVHQVFPLFDLIICRPQEGILDLLVIRGGLFSRGI